MKHKDFIERIKSTDKDEVKDKFVSLLKKEFPDAEVLAEVHAHPNGSGKGIWYFAIVLTEPYKDFTKEEIEKLMEDNPQIQEENSSKVDKAMGELFAWEVPHIGPVSFIFAHKIYTVEEERKIIDPNKKVKGKGGIILPS